MDAVEVSNGLRALRAEQGGLVGMLAADFQVFAETGAKDGQVPVVTADWLEEMHADLAAGARWVIAEGRESGTVGLYTADGSPRAELVDAIAERIGLDRVIFEAPKKSQQVWFIRRFGAGANLGNVPVAEVLPLETLRLGLRADTALETSPRDRRPGTQHDRPSISRVVAKASTEPLFSVQAQVLAGPTELAWIDEPDVEVINAMARGCAPQRPGTCCLVRQFTNACAPPRPAGTP